MDAGRQLTAEQRERISHNFKQAKIIRDRKRSQMNANSPGPQALPLSSTPCPPSATGRFSLDNSTTSSPDFRSPALKKINNSPAPFGTLERKALSDIQANTQRSQFLSRPPQDIRSISKEFLECSPMPVMKENHYSHRRDQNRFPTFNVPSSVKFEITPVLLVEAKAQLTGSAEQDGITNGLSQTFDEALLQEIDALCQQKSSNREATLQTANLSVPEMRVESVQDELQQLEDSSLIMTEGNGAVQGLPILSTMAPKELSSTCAPDLLLRKEANPRNYAQNSTPVSVVFDGSQSALTANSNFESHLNASISRQLSTSAGGDAQPSTTDSVMLNSAVPAHLRKLNASQREAATSDTTKPLLILAGPGSGKTSTMVARLLTLLEEGVQHANILAMTFTTAAATEMRERAAAAVGKALAKELIITTFHSFCLQICRSHADKLGRTSEFLIFAHGQQRKAVIEATRIATSELKACQNTGLDEDQAVTHPGNDNPSIWKDKARKWQQFVAQAKCDGKTSEDYEKAGNTLGAAVLRNYEKTLAACDALDYHDFITFAVNLLKDHQEVLEDCQKTWTCILVDEFQDTSTMQYCFLKLLASHNRITIVGDDDQSIFGFNGANSSGFESFRRDFPDHKEVRLHQNYRSTRCIVEAASALIKNNIKRYQSKQAFTDNQLGDKIEVRECRNEPAQCALVADHILMSGTSSDGFSYGNIAVLYRRQVTGKLFQAAFRTRKIPFNVHGVAFYRKKVIKTVTALLWTAIPGRKDIFLKRVFKALYCGDKSETKKVLEYVEKIAKSKACDFHQAAVEIFSAKISGTFNRRQLALGRKVLASIRTMAHVVSKEQSLSAVVTTAATLLPQRPIFDKRAVVTEDGGKLLNEDEDPRTIMEFLLDDVNDFLSNHFNPAIGGKSEFEKEGRSLGGRIFALKAFLNHLAAREQENFRGRRQEDKNSVTLTTIHQSKGLEWDTVFIVKVNDTETPLLHEGHGYVSEASVSLEEERRLFYVAMTRARKKLYLTYVVVDSQRQVLQPSRFLNELPRHLLDFQDETVQQVKTERSPVLGEQKLENIQQKLDAVADAPANESVTKIGFQVGELKPGESENVITEGRLHIAAQGSMGAAFLKGFNIESRSVVALLFHTWAKKPCFQDPSRLVSKVGFVIDERLRTKGTKNKDVLISLKCVLKEEAALAYARHVLAWEKLPAEERAALQAERQEHFQQQNSERSQASAPVTPKQLSFLRSLGCTVEPTSRLHASRLIEQYKKL
ncbi:unnamed protein product [Calypogeia fissa]